MENVKIMLPMDDTLEQTCIHKQFLNREDRVLNIVNKIPRVEVTIGNRAPVSGVVSIPSIGRERYVYWVWCNRRFHSRILSSIVVLTERIIPQNAQRTIKSVLISMTIRCLHSCRVADRRGLWDHEKSVVDKVKTFERESKTFPKDLQGSVNCFNFDMID